MNLRCGLTSPSGAWEQLLLMEGLPFGLVNFDRAFDRADWSVVAVTAPPPAREAERLREYLEDGGAILGPASFLGEVTGMPFRRERVRYLLGEEGAAVEGMQLCDLDTEACIPLEAHALRTDAGSFALFAGSWHGGQVAALPFDPAAALMDPRAALRRFYDRRERLPGERVSRVAKAEVFRLVHTLLELLHHRRGMPYAHLWYFPGTAESVFAFRVDTDGGTPGQIRRLREIAREHDLRMSWYLDVRSHESWLAEFAGMADQELGIHCFEHRTTGIEETDLRNIRKAVDLLSPYVGRPEGFAGPFGVWNEGLASAVDAAGFATASEFSYAYDGLPFYPEAGGRRFRALQVPIHPVCAGSLRKAGYDESAMLGYFSRVMDRKLALGEPLFFYHHPQDTRWDMVSSLIGIARATGAPFMSLGEYARWWRGRLRFRCTLQVESGGVRVVPGEGTGALSGDLGIRRSWPDGTVRLAPAVSSGGTGDDRPVLRRPTPPPRDIARMREADLRFTLGTIVDTILRHVP